MRRAALAIVCLMWAPSVQLLAAPPPQRPFETVLPWSLERGRWEAAFGAVYRRDVPPPFFGDEADFQRDEWRLSIVDVTLGLGGGGEVQAQFGVQRFQEEGGLEKTGIQDARIAFTYEVPFRHVSTAFRFLVKLPNAAGEKRLGTDETDTFAIASLGGRGGKWGWAANAGLGILGHPSQAGNQDDVLIAGAAGWLDLARGARPVSLIAEATGLFASRFTNDARYARAGVRMGGRTPVDLSLRRGLTAHSEAWGIEAGMTLFH